MATRKKAAPKDEAPAKEASTEVAVVEEATTALSVESVPSFMAQGREGLEVLTQKDIELPWLKLLQGTSPGLHENGWRAGNFLHSILEEEVLGDEGFTITPILALQPRYMLFNPLDQGGGILARAEDGVNWSPPNHEFRVKINSGSKEVSWKTAKTVAASGLDKWGSSDPDDPNSGPAADLQYRYICVSPSHPEFGPFIILLQRSGVKAAKRLNALLTNARVPSFGQVIHVSALWEDKGPNDKKFVWKFTPRGFVADEAQYNENKGLYETMSEMDVAIHDEEATATADDNSAATPAAPAAPAAGTSDEF